MVLKKPPTGSSPRRWLWETLNVTRWERLVSSLGKLPENWLKEKSTTSRMVNLAISGGIEPVRLLWDRSLQNQRRKTGDS